MSVQFSAKFQSHNHNQYPLLYEMAEQLPLAWVDFGVPEVVYNTGTYVFHVLTPSGAVRP